MAVELKDIGFDYGLKFKKTTFELLSTPYMQSCDQYCDQDYQFQQNQCTKNPFIEENSTFHDSNKIHNKICDKPMNLTNVGTKSCRIEFYKIRSENNLAKNHGDSTLRIHGNILVEHKYTAFARMGLVEFMANIGGLFGLYLGMSVIDMSEIIKLLIPLAKNISRCLKKLTIFKIFRTKVFKLIINIFKIQQFIETINWKRLFTIMSIPVLIVQLYKSIQYYLDFSTEISFEFIPYNRNLTKYSLSDFPAITVCNEHIFDKILFEPNFIQAYIESDRVEFIKQNDRHNGMHNL